MATTNEIVTFESRVSNLAKKMQLLIQCTGESDTNKRTFIENAFLEETVSLCELFDEARYIPITDICQLATQAIIELCNSDQSLTQQQFDFLMSWPKQLIELINAPTDLTTVNSSLEFIKSNYFLTPITNEDAEALKSFIVFDGIESESDISTLNIEPLEINLEPVLQKEGLKNQNESEIKQQTKSQLTDGQQVLIDVMKLELSQIIEPIKIYLTQATNNDNDIKLVSDALDDYADLVQRVSAGFEAMGLSGFYFICDFINSNLRELSYSKTTLNEQQVVELLKWPPLMFNCLEYWKSEEHSNNLAQHLLNNIWPIRLSTDEITTFKTGLSSSEIVLDVEDIEPRKTTADISDINLDLPEDVNLDLLESLLYELPTQASDFSSAIQKSISGGYVSDIEEAMRIAHTIKGAANTVGISGLATLSHQIEDILEAFTKADTLPSGNIAESLILASDCLESMTETLTTLSPPPEEALFVLQSLLDWANFIDKNGIPESSDDIEIKTLITSSVDKIIDINNTNDSEEKEAQNITPMLRVPASLVDNLLRVVGESIILTGQIQEKLKRTIVETNSVKQQNKYLTDLSHELEQLVDIQQINLPIEKSNINSDFDSLEMSQYSELHTCAHRFIEAVTDSNELSSGIDLNLNQLEQMLLDQHKLNMDAQENVLKTRMVSVNTILPRLQRSIRQASRLTNKEVELVVSGTETPIDSDVITQLVDPLMHILRNAVDHGIESDEVRLNANKPANGIINLDFSREGNNILVRCIDDGNGFNLDTIRETAIENGLINESQYITDDDTRRLILKPGFTTTESTNQLSGRGVGMDIVYTKILQLKGSLKLDSTDGHGSVIEIRIPVTLLSTHALLARSGQHTIAISNRGIQQILYSGAGNLTTQGDTLTYQINDEVYLAKNIDTLIDIEQDINSKSLQNKTALLIEDDLTKTIVLVDEVTNTKDLVVKNMGHYVSKQAGIVGATILGDGSVTPVIDLPDLLRNSQSSSNITTTNQSTPVQTTNEITTVLVVDDSLSARKSLILFMQDIGFNVISAKDGIEAIEKMESDNPQLLITDLEMPRMNGLELCSHIRAKNSGYNIPIIMVTSRSTEKHRQKAIKTGVDEYLTKPYSEDKLLNTINVLMAETDA